MSRIGTGKSAEALTSLDREAAMFRVRTGEEGSAAAYTIQGFLVALMASFAGIALALTVVGIYGLLSYAVARRRHEIGLRIALGGGAAGVQGMLKSIVLGVRAGDAVFLVAASAAIAIAGVAAAYVPALRAAPVDPMRALRSE